MFEQAATTFYLCYAILCAVMGVAYIRFRSTEINMITTKEFKIFQNGFLTGYSAIILSELVASASFYHTLISLRLNLNQITKLYMITVVSSTVTSFASEIIDVGARKDKCVFSALLYSISMFSLFFGGHYEMLLMGRIVYGAASSLHHSSFESYAIHEHASLGFPEDWLSQTFSFLTHAMALMAALSGVMGQIAAATGPLGCVGFCCLLFALTAFYIAFMWEKDMNTPRFMLSGLIFNTTQTIQAMKSNQQIPLLFLIASLCETSITIFTFYWAPWITSIVIEEDQDIPYEILFSTLIVGSMLGNYLFQMYSNQIGMQNLFQAILITSSVSYFLGAMFQTSFMAFIVSVSVQICMGGYWPSIGYLRGKVIVPELRSMALIVPRIMTSIFTVIILSSIHHSPMMILSTCAILNGIAAYIQNNYLDSKALRYDGEEGEDEDDETDNNDERSVNNKGFY